MVGFDAVIVLSLSKNENRGGLTQRTSCGGFGWRLHNSVLHLADFRCRIRGLGKEAWRGEIEERDAIMTKQDYYMFADDYYQRLAEGSDMSVDSTGSTPMSMSNGGNLVIISSMADSSVGSNNSVQTRPIADLHFQTATHNTSVVSYIVMLLGVAPPHTLGEDSSLGYEVSSDCFDFSLLILLSSIAQSYVLLLQQGYSWRVVPIVAFTAYPFLSFLIGTIWHGIQAAKARGKCYF